MDICFYYHDCKYRKEMSFMENLIKTYNLEPAKSQEYDTVFFDLYADYEKNCMLLGRKIILKPHNLESGVVKEVVRCTDICCVLKININDHELSKSLKDAVLEAVESPVFYKIRHWQDTFLQYPYEFGFAKIPNESGCGDQIYKMTGPDNVGAITCNIDEQLRRLEALNVPAFKTVLSNWVKIHPKTLYDDREQNQPIYDALKFIRDWQFLLLSEDKELRDLYLEYKKKYGDCFCSKMTMDR